MKTLTTGFFTTLNWPMVQAALGFLFWPWNWLRIRSGRTVQKLEQELAKYLKVKHLYSFYNGRSAIYHGLKLLGIKKGDEVILQAYTCVSVPNAIIQAGATPIYTDVQAQTLNIDPQLIEQKISSKTKAILVQHTFGIPVDLKAITKLCNKYKLYLIEDCAHALGAEYPHSQKVGGWGDIAIFSLGRDKVISSVSGGFLSINNPDLNKKYVHTLNPMPRSLVLKSLVYLPIAYISRLSYDIFIGKVVIFLARKLHIIPEILSGSERKCQDKTFNYALPNCLAHIGLHELKQIDKYNRHRQELAQFYSLELSKIPHQEALQNTSAIFLRYTIFANRSTELMSYCKQRGVILGDWYRWPIAPRGVDYSAAGYEEGSCPIAEKQASRTINLPNHPGISQSDAKRVVKIIKKFYQ